jgi:hypothetical protein
MDRGGSDKYNTFDNDTVKEVKRDIYQRSLCITLIGVTMRQTLAVVVSC